MNKMVICMSLLIGQAWGLSCVLPEESDSQLNVLWPSQDSDDDDDDETSICFGSS
jgi:hypothetical protein